MKRKLIINGIIYLTVCTILCCLCWTYEKEINKWFKEHKAKEYEIVYIEKHKYIEYYNAEGKVLMHSEECTNPKHKIK